MAKIVTDGNAKAKTCLEKDHPRRGGAGSRDDAKFRPMISRHHDHDKLHLVFENEKSLYMIVIIQTVKQQGLQKEI